MVAYLVIVLAALSRLHGFVFHDTAMNVTAVGAGLLFFGSRRPRIEVVVAAVLMAVTDLCLTVGFYHYPFHVRGYIVTWCWYAAAALIGSGLLRKVTVLRVAAGVFASATSFFFISNFTVWMGHMYQHTLSGLALCYWAALPYYRNDLLSTAAFSALFFGVPVLAAHFSASAESKKVGYGSAA